MPTNQTTKADAFHEAMLDIITKSYKNKENDNEAWKSDNAKQQESLEQLTKEDRCKAKYIKKAIYLCVKHLFVSYLIVIFKS